MARTRQKAQSTLLREANEKIADLEKKLKSATDNRDHYSRANDKLEKEIAEVHAMLDATDGTPERCVKVGYCEHTLSIVARLGAYFAGARKAKPRESD